MKNEEVTREVIAVVKKGTIKSAREILNIIQKLWREAKGRGKGLKEFIDEKKPVRVKDLVKKGKVETLELNDVDMKNLKRQLRRNGVKFTIKKDLSSGNNIIFFEARNSEVMQRAFDSAVAKFRGREKKRESVMDKLSRFKEKVKNTPAKDKVKEKQQEQSL